jgi:hypothetical protein
MKKVSRETQINVLKLFNVMVLDGSVEKTPDTSLLGEYGVVTDFAMKPAAANILKEVYAPLDARTLFGREERDVAPLYALLMKQFLHYVEVYGLDKPGLFDLEVNTGTIVKLRLVRGVTPNEFAEMVRKLLYANAPVSDAVMIKNMINEYSISYDVNKIANNELRVALFDEKRDVLLKGDDVVRYMVYKATENLMLIKSKEVVEAVAKYKFSHQFLDAHAVPLSQVFNRHKRIIVAAKNKSNRTAVNRITRLSKVHHVPLGESLGKRFVGLALAGKTNGKALEFANVSLRDKFKMLNLLEYKKMGNDMDAFIIRNGKIHIETGRSTYSAAQIAKVEKMILKSLKKDLEYLKGKNILLDADVDLGLPISRKQTIGNLPFGTTVIVDDRISSGVYWHNDGGAYDLDLSTIDRNGNRTGWGGYSGYSKKAEVTFSGDVTDARNGAMEFMTSKDASYGLFANIYRGNPNATFELVIGKDGKAKDRWMDDVKVREKGKLTGRGSIIGFVDGNQFTVYQGMLNSNHWSSNDKSRAVVSRGTSKFWTVSQLLTELGIKFDVDKNENTVYDYDLTYAGFSFDKLEDLLSQDKVAN